MALIKTLKPIILGSGSETRLRLLKTTELEFQQIKPELDEDALKQSLDSLSAKDLSLKLASEKALSLSKKHKDAYVIGADQICEFNGEFLDKPGSIENCIEHLTVLSGKTHLQNCATVLAHNGEIIWSHHGLAKLKMRNLTEEEIKAYVELENPIHSCGSYMFERHGKHLFQSVEGNDDIILGLAIVELLSEFYRLGAIELTV